MRVAFSLRVVGAGDYNERRDALSHDWIRWIETRDWTPILVPNALREPGKFMRELGANLLILTGGNDSVPTDPADTDHEPIRDQCEFALIRTAEETGLPILGICRGMHMVNRYFGGRILPMLTADNINHVAAEHFVTLAGPMAETAGVGRIETNSFHNQAIERTGLGKDLTAFAFSEADGLIEGLVHDHLPILATQWHPERNNPAAAVDDRLINRFVEEGAFWAAI